MFNILQMQDHDQHVHQTFFQPYQALQVSDGKGLYFLDLESSFLKTHKTKKTLLGELSNLIQVELPFNVLIMITKEDVRHNHI